MQGSYDYFPLERVVFGKPLATALAEEMARLDRHRAFFVTSGSLGRGTGIAPACCCRRCCASTRQ